MGRHLEAELITVENPKSEYQFLTILFQYLMVLSESGPNTAPELILLGLRTQNWSVISQNVTKKLNYDMKSSSISVLLVFSCVRH